MRHAVGGAQPSPMATVRASGSGPEVRWPHDRVRPDPSAPVRRDGCLRISPGGRYATCAFRSVGRRSSLALPRASNRTGRAAGSGLAACAIAHRQERECDRRHLSSSGSAAAPAKHETTVGAAARGHGSEANVARICTATRRTRGLSTRAAVGLASRPSGSDDQAPASDDHQVFGHRLLALLHCRGLTSRSGGREHPRSRFGQRRLDSLDRHVVTGQSLALPTTMGPRDSAPRRGALNDSADDR
jgi:hypothetical protein